MPTETFNVIREADSPDLVSHFGANSDRLAPFIHSDTLPATGDQAPWRLFTLRFVVPTMNCAACMGKIERHFAQFPQLASVRINLSLRHVVICWRGPDDHSPVSGQALLDEFEGLGFEARPLLDSREGDDLALELRALVWCLAVAGFATANVMLLSVSIWSGAEGATRDLFHWLSALIALPAVVFAGRPFYISAWQALRAGRVNMDVPISLAVILAAGLSLFETITRGEHAFFDAAVSLLFFLLIGRTLDLMMRARAFHGVQQLLALKSQTAQIITNTGHEIIPIQDLVAGHKVFVRPGETIPVDGRVIAGMSDVDWSLVTGESVPQTAKIGTELFSGLINLSGPITIEAEAVGEGTLLAEIARYMETAQSAAPRYRQLADRAAALYAPVVHLAGALTFAVWLFYGAPWQAALFTAISVLIITCPCALGLAVPVVQVVASSIAQRRGILMKEGAALEKLSEIDTVVFDKTGTLTLAAPELVSSHYEMSSHQDTEAELKQADLLAGAKTLAMHSLHPLSQALGNVKSPTPSHPEQVEDVQEHPGFGLTGKWRGGELRLGSAAWCGIDGQERASLHDLTLWAAFREKGGRVHYGHFGFEDQLRRGAKQVIDFFKEQGLELYLLSGDQPLAVKRLAGSLGIINWHAEMKPGEKADFLARLGSQGRKVLMVGDGINDGPALKTAFVSLSPSKASDVAQVTASFVLMRETFAPIIDLYQLARLSQTLIWQNFSLAFLYNLIAIPLAALGGVTPIAAALAMSGSSLVVMGNALRLNYLARPRAGAKIETSSFSGGGKIALKELGA